MNILDQHNGKWEVTDRLTLWQSEGPLLTDELLDKFAELVIKVLLESDPELDLPKDKRFAASLYGRKRNYSKAMREGMTETLALMGARSEDLTTCTHGKGETIASKVVHELLHSADAGRWASLNNELPLLAEASPRVFLREVDDASDDPNEPFSDIFSEEDSGVFSRNFITGLLWGLESLAWSSDYLTQVCNILANLATIDPGGNYANRPGNSLVAILLPWLPQTCAKMDQRHNAVKCIRRNHPDVAWEVLLQLLPKRHGTSSPTHKPKWRAFIPDDRKEGVTNAQRWEDEGFYADLALEMAGNNSARLIELLPFYFYIHPNFSNFAREFRQRLVSSEVLALPEDQRLKLWTALTNKTSNHRKYADSDAWAAPEDALEELDRIADKLKPQKPEIRHKRLFSGHDIDLYDERGNWEEQRSRLLQRRVEAVHEIIRACGFSGLEKFWRSVESPSEVGNSLGSAPLQELDAATLRNLIESKENADVQFALSYSFRRLHQEGWDWVDSFNRSKWPIHAKAVFFANLPFVDENWNRVATELKGNENQYWKRARVHPESNNLARIGFAIDQLIQNGRADAAIQCFWLGSLWGGEYSELALKALGSLNNDNRIDTHAIGEVFTHLQKDENVDEEKLASLEFKFLSLLDKFGDARPNTLYKHLAERPQFFCEVIRMIYRSKNEDSEEEGINQANAHIAEQAYKLISDWDRPPGLLKDGTFDDRDLNKWFLTVKTECEGTGHWEAASHQIGEVLFYAPKDEKGLWIKKVCELLDSKDNGRLRSGLHIRIFNSRGAHWFSGGKEEIKLAEQWEKLAEQAESGGFARLGSTLREVGRSYREDAKRSVSEHGREFD